MSLPSYEILIPAHSESERIGELIQYFRRAYWPERLVITVVDNGSDDGTAQMALEAGADTVINETRLGKGFAIKAGLAACHADRILLCDADIAGLQPPSLIELADLSVVRNVALARIAIRRPLVDAPVTALLAQPLLAALGLQQLLEPLGGIACVDRRWLDDQHIPGDWGFDVGMTILALRASGDIPELEVDGVTHRSKALEDFVPMAREVARSIMHVSGLLEWEHANCVLCGA